MEDLLACMGSLNLLTTNISSNKVSALLDQAEPPCSIIILCIIGVIYTLNLNGHVITTIKIIKQLITGSNRYADLFCSKYMYMYVHLSYSSFLVDMPSTLIEGATPISGMPCLEGFCQ